MTKIKHLLLLIVLALAATFSLSPQLALASCDNPVDAEEAIRCGANQVGGEDNAEPQNLSQTIENIINIFSVIIGVIAVIMIMVGGLRYITSAGDSNRIASAKNTIVMALIGLIIVALAQVIVKFVLNSATNTASSGSSSSQGECQRTRNGAFWIGGPNHGKAC